ncbi:thiamine-phosphate kinase [Halanaeroarchaeum sulfurireducens]|uniref:Thiamine-monophosphate kinase n=1 Tax=Halanaeroarchaeum sulfurireducens TaxID=1604004 RepID=A0A0F7PAQ3_9EURY|nr:thiamine-phosphate kinase [Halanaeroarchaeum sulfurireducens]AKH96704.1 thiamine-monophosphate kinase [Halanaeroarchaeum sulfurireducens]ALG81106.1 thiamine-monophosphate kinase [Halanaeroarchaeum sulfurireducens]
MDERAALDVVGGLVDAAGDDTAVIGDTMLTIDMLHDETDFPAGTTPYTMGWRSVGASLSDVAAMGAEATATVAVYGAPSFEAGPLEAFVTGASDVSGSVGAEYVGGDLDGHQEVTVATAAIGTTETPILREGASPGEVVCVTGALGRSAAAVRYFEQDDQKQANDLFQFSPRVAAGRALAPKATAMMDSSDGLARSLHQLAEASDVGFAVDRDAIPVDPALVEVAGDQVVHEAMTFGEDFELVCTLPEGVIDSVRSALSIPLSVVGRVIESDAGIHLDGEPIRDEGWTHGRTP